MIGGLRTIPADSDAQQLSRLARWIVRLRWLAVIGVLLTALFARFGLGAISATSLRALVLTAVVMSGYNAVFEHLSDAHLGRVSAAYAQVLLDLLALTVMLCYTGGAKNPFETFYVFHVVIAGILLQKRDTYVVSFGACSLFCGMVLLQETGAVPSNSLLLGPASADLIHESQGWVGVLGILVAFTTTVGCTAYFTTTIMARVRWHTDELLEASEILSQERGKLEDIARNVGAAMLVLDAESRILWANEIAKGWFGGELGRGRCFKQLWQLDAPCDRCPRAGGYERMREQTVVLDGKRRHFLISCSQVHSADGKLGQVLTLIQDTTPMKEMEFQLHQAGKMAAVGQLAAGIAHEINNPLAVVSSSTEILLDFVQKDERDDAGGKLLARHLEKIDASVYRCKGIIDSLLGFARRDVGGVEEVDVGALLNETVHLALHSAQTKPCEIVRDYAIEARSLISSEYDRHPASHRVRTRPRELQQALLNIMLNAVDATRPGGTVTVSLELRGARLEICIDDRGEGIAPEHLDRIFEPFFTTKPVGQGTGLGLYLSRQLLLPAVDGTISVESQPGEGSRFRVSIPWEVSGEARKGLHPLERPA